VAEKMLPQGVLQIFCKLLLESVERCDILVEIGFWGDFDLAAFAAASERRM